MLITTIKKNNNNNKKMSDIYCLVFLETTLNIFWLGVLVRIKCSQYQHRSWVKGRCSKKPPFFERNLCTWLMVVSNIFNLQI